MRIKGITAIVLAISPCMARLPEAQPEVRITVCMESGSGGPEFGVIRMLAARILADAGVKPEWRRTEHCPEGALLARLSDQTPETLHPGALGYASPFEGTHIVIFLDRIQRMFREQEQPTILAYVLVHEITHILERLCAHSKSGIMKAHWAADDYRRMSGARLRFGLEDIDLIHRGVARRVSDAESALAQ